MKEKPDYKAAQYHELFTIEENSDRAEHIKTLLKLLASVRGFESMTIGEISELVNGGMFSDEDLEDFIANWVPVYIQGYDAFRQLSFHASEMLAVYDGKWREQMDLELGDDSPFTTEAEYTKHIIRKFLDYYRDLMRVFIADDFMENDEAELAPRDDLEKDDVQTAYEDKNET